MGKKLRWRDCQRVQDKEWKSSKMKLCWLRNSNTGTLSNFSAVAWTEKKWCWFMNTCRTKAWIPSYLVRPRNFYFYPNVWYRVKNSKRMWCKAFFVDQTKRSCLVWTIRCNIIIGVARGVLYLHQDSRLRVIHRDLKASNVLLDMGMNPKISDFGMARLFTGDQIQDKTNRIVGT